MENAIFSHLLEPMRIHASPEPGLPVWARIADALTVVLLAGCTACNSLRRRSDWNSVLDVDAVEGTVWTDRHLCTAATISSAPPRCTNAYGAGWYASYTGRCVLGSAVWSVFEHATRMTVTNALHIFAVTALAVAQPLFEVVSREPAFFVARNTTFLQLGAFVVLVGVVLPLVLVGIEAVAARLHAVVGNVVHALLLTALGVALLLPSFV